MAALAHHDTNVIFIESKHLENKAPAANALSMHHRDMVMSKKVLPCLLLKLCAFIVEWGACVRFNTGYRVA